MKTVMEVEGLVKKFHRRPVLQDVGFDVRPNEVLGLIGPNGSGKTTLFECVAGLLPANQGAVRYLGANLSLTERKKHIFYLPDGIVPWEEQTVNAVLRFFQRLYHGSASSLSQLVDLLQLNELLHARIGSLSKGERKRTLLAAVLLTPHPVLMLDEPFDGLDLRQTREVMRLLKDHAGNRRTLILSIHQLVDAGRVCDRLVLLSSGRMVGQGTISELQDKANLPGASLEEIFLALT